MTGLGLVLPACCLLTLGMGVVTALAAWPVRGAGYAMAALSALSAALAVVALATGLRDAVGLPAIGGGTGAVAAIDPVSAAFLLPLCLAGTAAGLYGAGSRLPALAPGLLAAGLLALLAADGATLLVGFGLVMAAFWLLTAGTAPRWWSGPVPVAAFLALAVAVALLGPAGTLRFDAIRRAAPPEGWRAAAVLALALVAAAPAIGLAPLHGLRLAAQSAAGGPAAALAGSMGLLGLYLLARLLFDLCGPATPPAWGVPLLLLGAAGAVAGSWHAGRATQLGGVAAGAGVLFHGLATVALGVALAARGADLPPLAGFAAGAATLQVLVSSLVGTSLALGADAAGQGGGSHVLDRLGGLVHGMPLVAACLFAAIASLAALPPSAGFAALWALVQALVAAPRIGGLALQVLLLAVLAATGLAVALGTAAGIRMAGIALLGRPRTPRAAAATDLAGPGAVALVGLAGLAGLAGLLPGAVQRLMAGPGSAGDRMWLALTVQPDTPGYAPLGLLPLLGLLAAGLGAALARIRTPAGPVLPAWRDGFGNDPAWLPFGDPATQYTASSFTQPLAAMVPPVPSWRGWTIEPMAVVLGLVVAGLVAAIWLVPV